MTKISTTPAAGASANLTKPIAESEARDLAGKTEIDLAILDVNIDGEEIFPVADILASRGKPFVFVTGYGGQGLPENYRSRPTLQKPFQIEDLKTTLETLVPTDN